MPMRTHLAARGLYRLAASVLIVLFGAGMVHNHLVRSAPDNGQSLPGSPAEIRLWFAERPEVAFTSITLIRATPDSIRVGPIKAATTDDTLAVKLAVPSTLQPGDWIVAWRTASRDGHAIRGRFRFTITP